MLNKETKVRLRPVENSVIIDLIGDVTNRGEKAIKGAYQQALDSEPKRVFFNFSETEYINTSGVAVLIAIVMAAEKAGRKIGLFGMNAHYRKVFTLVRLPLYAEIYDTESQALAGL